MTDTINNAYLALGSNIRAEKNLPEAVRLLAEQGEIVSVSRVWESAPVGFVEQDHFLNGAVLLQTTSNIQTIRNQIIPTVESKLLRRRDPSNKNAPRTIDVDLVLFNDVVVQEETFTLPDPEILTRPFLILPLAEINPDYRHPVQNQTLQQIADEVMSTCKPLLERKDVTLRNAG